MVNSKKVKKMGRGAGPWAYRTDASTLSLIEDFVKLLCLI